jgi:hypothetical protein
MCVWCVCVCDVCQCVCVRVCWQPTPCFSCGAVCVCVGAVCVCVFSPCLSISEEHITHKHTASLTHTQKHINTGLLRVCPS